MRYLKVIS